MILLNITKSIIRDYMRMMINNNEQKCQPDPYVLEDGGKFYVFTTGVDGVKCYKSSKLQGEYEYIGIVFNREGFKEYWAPAVIKYQGKYYMYVSYMPSYEEDVHTQKLIVAVASQIDGKYEYLNDLCQPFSIDAHPVINETGLYMFYSINEYEGDKVGTRIVLDKMISPTKLLGNPKVVVSPSLEEEIYMKNRFKEGQDWYTIEGACYFNEGDYHYLLYSANCWQNKFYFVGYSMCKSGELDLTKLEFNKYPNDTTYQPLLSKNEFESGTGHNTVIKYNDEWYIVYHGRDVEEENEEFDNRSMRIAKLVVDGEKLLVIRKNGN